jgi:hypothetical protein
METIKSARDQIINRKSSILVTASTILDGCSIGTNESTLKALKILVDILPKPKSRDYSAGDFVEAFYVIRNNTYHSCI